MRPRSEKKTSRYLLDTSIVSFYSFLVSKKLLQELRQNKPFRSITQEAVLELMKTTDFIRRRLARALDPHDLSLQQYNVLRILRGAGSDGLPTLEVAARTIEETPGITRLLDKLEGKRLVRRERCSADRRQVLCWITPSGEELLASLDRQMDQSVNGVFDRLQPEQLRTMIDWLEQIRLE